MWVVLKHSEAGLLAVFMRNPRQDDGPPGVGAAIRERLGLVLTHQSDWQDERFLQLFELNLFGMQEPSFIRGIQNPNP